ncbi:MAG: hypothetical protein ACKESB_01510 [Candidatus Hodgkinia cicadicola]
MLTVSEDETRFQSSHVFRRNYRSCRFWLGSWVLDEESSRLNGGARGSTWIVDAASWVEDLWHFASLITGGRCTLRLSVLNRPELHERLRLSQVKTYWS